MYAQASCRLTSCVSSHALPAMLRSFMPNLCCCHPQGCGGVPARSMSTGTAVLAPLCTAPACFTPHACPAPSPTHAAPPYHQAVSHVAAGCKHPPGVPGSHNHLPVFGVLRVDCCIQPLRAAAACCCVLLPWWNPGGTAGPTAPLAIFLVVVFQAASSTC